MHTREENGITNEAIVLQDHLKCLVRLQT